MLRHVLIDWSIVTQSKPEVICTVQASNVDAGRQVRSLSGTLSAGCISKTRPIWYVVIAVHAR